MGSVGEFGEGQRGAPIPHEPPQPTNITYPTHIIAGQKGAYDHLSARVAALLPESGLTSRGGRIRTCNP